MDMELVDDINWIWCWTNTVGDAVGQGLHRRECVQVPDDHNHNDDQDYNDDQYLKDDDVEVEEQVKRGLERSETVGNMREDIGSRCRGSEIFC